MTADTRYSLTAALHIQIAEDEGGSFGIVNQDPDAIIEVILSTIGSGPAGETIYLRALGETLAVDRLNLRSATIRAIDATGADAYPAMILLVNTPLGVSLTSLGSAVAEGTGGALGGGLAGPAKSTVVSVNTTAVPLPATPLTARKAVVVQAPASNAATVYLGGSTVTADETATGGLQLAPGESIPLDLSESAILYGIATGAEKIVILEVA